MNLPTSSCPHILGQGGIGVTSENSWSCPRRQVGRGGGGGMGGGQGDSFRSRLLTNCGLIPRELWLSVLNSV